MHYCSFKILELRAMGGNYLTHLDDSLRRFFSEIFFGSNLVGASVFVSIFLISLSVAVFLQYSFSYFVKMVVAKYQNNLKIPFIKYLIKEKFHNRVAQLAPLIFLNSSLPPLLYRFPTECDILIKITQTYGIFVIITILTSIIRSIIDLLRERDEFKDKPMESLEQVLTIIFWIIGLFFIYNIFTGKTISSVLGFIGAASAVILLVFKDTILGFVASIAVTTNDMVRIGDWITMPDANADGDVIEINLNTVKVQNFDKTITTIPTYKLISNSFQNWRGMYDSGGRRIKRSLNIVQSTVRFVEEDDLLRLSQIQEISGYIEERRKEIEDYNSQKKVDKRVLINGRNMTNLGLFRKYADYYLRNHPRINKKMSMMVRQLSPTSKGIPIEVYAFTDTIVWVEYESIQSDIFDHLIAAVPFFDLEIFEDLHNSSNRDERNKVLLNEIINTKHDNV